MVNLADAIDLCEIGKLRGFSNVIINHLISSLSFNLTSLFLIILVCLYCFVLLSFGSVLVEEGILRMSEGVL
jgi:hypothetical protein